MKLVAFTCPGCGAQLSVDLNKKVATCQFCGATFPIDDEAQHIRYDNAEQAGYEFEKGRLRAQEEYARSQRQGQYQAPTTLPYQPEQPKKKHRTWLWILGWIYIFPVPLTILMMRNKRLNEKLRMGIIIATWIIFIALMISANGSSTESKPETAASTTEMSQQVDDTAADSGEQESPTAEPVATDNDVTPGTNAANYVVSRLAQVEHVQEPTAVTEDHDPNHGLSKADGYIAAVYFSCNLVEKDVKGDDVIDRGTDGGGCVEVYRNEADAKKRDDYLGTAGNFLGLAGSHTVSGVYVVRTSRHLTKSQQGRLEKAIIEALAEAE